MYFIKIDNVLFYLLYKILLLVLEYEATRARGIDQLYFSIEVGINREINFIKLFFNIDKVKYS